MHTCMQAHIHRNAHVQAFIRSLNIPTVKSWSYTKSIEKVMNEEGAEILIQGRGTRGIGLTYSDSLNNPAVNPD